MANSGGDASTMVKKVGKLIRVRENGAKTSMNHRTYPVHGIVHALQRLKPLGHQEIRELFVNGLHFLRDLQYPLLVGIRRVVVGRGARTSGGEKRKEKKKKIFVFEMKHSLAKGIVGPCLIQSAGSSCFSTTLEKSRLAD